MRNLSFTNRALYLIEVRRRLVFAGKLTPAAADRASREPRRRQPSGGPILAHDIAAGAYYDRAQPDRTVKPG
jgi:hypothetical protein